MAATPALLDSGSGVAAGSGVANPMAAVLDEFPLRVSEAAAWISASHRRYERFVEWVSLAKDVKALLIAIRLGHLLKFFSQSEKLTLMQLDIRWWREVRVCPALFDASPRSFLENLTSDRLDAVLQVRPPNHNGGKIRAVATFAASDVVGYMVIDGQLHHES